MRWKMLLENRMEIEKFHCHTYEVSVRLKSSRGIEVSCNVLSNQFIVKDKSYSCPPLLYIDSVVQQTHSDLSSFFDRFTMNQIRSNNVISGINGLSGGTINEKIVKMCLLMYRFNNVDIANICENQMTQQMVNKIVIFFIFTRLYTYFITLFMEFDTSLVAGVKSRLIRNQH